MVIVTLHLPKGVLDHRSGMTEQQLPSLQKAIALALSGSPEQDGALVDQKSVEIRVMSRHPYDTRKYDILIDIVEHRMTDTHNLFERSHELTEAVRAWLRKWNCFKSKRSVGILLREERGKDIPLD